MLTTQEIKTAVRSKLLEETTDLISESKLDFAINRAYEDIQYSSFTNDQIKTVEVTFVNGEADVPADFGTMYGPAFDGSKNRYQEQSIEAFDRIDGENAVTVEGGKLKIKPQKSLTLTVKYYPKYAALSAVQNPEVHPYLHELIVYGGVYRLHEDLQNEALAQYYKLRFEQELQNRNAKLANYEDDNQGGNEMFIGKRLI